MTRALWSFSFTDLGRQMETGIDRYGNPVAIEAYVTEITMTPWVLDGDGRPVEAPPDAARPFKVRSLTDASLSEVGGNVAMTRWERDASELAKALMRAAVAPRFKMAPGVQ